MAGNAGTIVRAQSFEESVTGGVDGAGRVENADQTIGIIVIFFERKHDATARFPPNAVWAIGAPALGHQNDCKQQEDEARTFHIGLRFSIADRGGIIEREEIECCLLISSRTAADLGPT